jgi:hypothetical protein
MSNNISGTIFINNEFRRVKDRFSFNFTGPGDVETIDNVSKCAIAQRNANTDATTANITASEYAIALAALKLAIAEDDNMVIVATALNKVIMCRVSAINAAKNAKETAKIAKAIKVITTATFTLNTNTVVDAIASNVIGS